MQQNNFHYLLNFFVVLFFSLNFILPTHKNNNTAGSNREKLLETGTLAMSPAYLDVDIKFSYIQKKINK